MCESLSNVFIQPRRRNVLFHIGSLFVCFNFSYMMKLEEILKVTYVNLIPMYVIKQKRSDIISINSNMALNLQKGIVGTWKRLPEKLQQRKYVGMEVNIPTAVPSPDYVPEYPIFLGSRPDYVSDFPPLAPIPDVNPIIFPTNVPVPDYPGIFTISS